MTEKKIPTAQQMKEYHQLRKVMTTADKYDVFTQNGKKGVKDATGDVLVPAEFDEVGCTLAGFGLGFAIPVVKDGKMALVSPDGKGTLITEPIYDHICFDDCFFVLVKDGKKGLATGGGEVIIPAEMDDIYTPFNSLTTYSKDGKFGFAMIGYGLMTQPEYESYDIEPDTEYLQVVKDGVSGYINEDGEFTTEEDERFFHASCD